MTMQTGYTDETFPAWYERLTDLERYDYDTDYATDDTDYATDDTTTPQQEPLTTTYTYSLINPTSDRDFPALVGSLVILGFKTTITNFRTIETEARPEVVDSLCCDLRILVEHDGQWFGCND